EYAAAMSGAPQSPAASESAHPAAEPTTAAPSAAAAPTSPSAAAAAPPAADAAVDQEAARRHMTEARNTLSQLTQLPAAAQLAGEARAQVSQLIANFNELITAQSDWRANYA